MRLNVPIPVRGSCFTRWDVLAFFLILGLLVFLGEASRHLFEPLPSCSSSRRRSIRATCPNMPRAPRCAC